MQADVMQADVVQAQSARNGRTRGSCAGAVGREGGSATGRTPRRWTSPPSPKNARGRCDLFLSFFGRNSLDHSSYIWAKRLSVNLQTRLSVQVLQSEACGLCVLQFRLRTPGGTTCTCFYNLEVPKQKR
ncbi:hypothetical protein CapIbe_020130 [Capra ibex]